MSSVPTVAHPARKNASDTARKSLYSDLTRASTLLANMRERHARGEYAGQSTNFIALLELQNDARNLGAELAQSNR